MLVSFDDAVGAILAAIREHGIDERTLLFFVSDNGGPTHDNTASNARSPVTKACCTKRIRVPYFVRWKEICRPD